MWATATGAAATTGAAWTAGAKKPGAGSGAGAARAQANRANRATNLYMVAVLVSTKKAAREFVL